jgi:Leucine-rich repeat (LRR) protein
MKPTPWLSTLVSLLWISPWLLAPAAAASASSSDHTNCSFDVQTETLLCFLPKLGSHNSSSIQSASRAGTVRVECVGAGGEADTGNESILRTNHFGYLPSLRRLDLESCRLRRIPSLAFSGLSGLKELNVRTFSNEVSAAVVMEVEDDAFTGLNDLRRLNLTHNNLWTLPRGAFCGLSGLAVLNLSVNYLQDVADLGFSSSELNSCRIPLRSLDLSHNSLSKLPSKSLGQLRKLEHLVLSSNTINVIEDGALAELSALVTLNLSGNKLVALPPDLFSQTKYLQELYLQNNSLSVLAPGLFEGLQHLLVLNLSSNDIGNDWLTPDTFSSCVRLVALDLSRNQLTKLDGSILAGLTSLQILDLSFNRLQTVAGNTFLSQHNLHMLKLSDNHIESLHPQSLSGLSVLSSLMLDRNRLSNLHKDVLQNTSLVDLGLAGNLLTFIPEAAKSLGKLKTLDVGDNLIVNLSNDSFRGLSNLYGLRLAGNKIEQFQSAVFATIPDLQALNLANNRLTNLDQSSFNSITKLRMLRLDQNHLEDINGILAGQTELRWLNVSSNRLQVTICNNPVSCFLRAIGEKTLKILES